jgi:hypothetical protein
MRICIFNPTASVIPLDMLKSGLSRGARDVGLELRSGAVVEGRYIFHWYQSRAFDADSGVAAVLAPE